MSESSGNAVLPDLDSAVERLRRLKSALGARLVAAPRVRSLFGWWPSSPAHDLGSAFSNIPTWSQILLAEVL